MDHHRQVNAVEHLLVEQSNLATVISSFFGRGADYTYSQAEMVGNASQRYGGADSGGGDNIMAAGMPYSW